MQHSSTIHTYRWFVFLITLGYFLYRFIDQPAGYFGAQFRFLTIWALTASTLSAWFMLRLSMGWSGRRHEVFASMTVVLNATVLLMYWKIYFTDPALFYGDGEGPVWHQEYFLHGLGPALQMIDAFFILGVFTRLKATALAVLVMPLAYVAWIEFLVHPLNDRPIGDVTTGLPYLFLNNMEVPARLTFYATTVGSMLVLFVIGATLAWALRTFSRRGAPQSP